MVEVEFSTYEVNQIVNALNLSIRRIKEDKDDLLGFKDSIIYDLEQIIDKLSK